MSNPLSVAMVTAALGRILGEALAGGSAGGVESAAVTTLRPDMLAGANGDARGVNVFLYQVSPNGDWAGSDLPTRRADGTLLAKPRQAVDLRYVLTFSGDESTLEPQRMLGLVVSTLATRPVLSREVVRDAIAHALDEDPTTWAQFSDLADQIDVVRLSLLPLNLEELSHLWSTFFQSPYRLSVTYQATVVLLEGGATPQPPLPVRSRGLGAAPVRAPSISQVTVDSGPTDPVLPGTTLRIDGQRLRGPAATRVRIGEVESVVPAGQAGDTRITVDLPAGVPAGIRGVQVLHEPGVESPAVPIVVRPAVTGPVAQPGDEAGEVDLTIPLAPPVGRTQRVVLALNEHHPPEDRPARGYQFAVAARDAEVTEIAVVVTDVVAGEYLVRVQVDGAESVLDAGLDGRFDQPRVSIP
jgi:Pvc16 N-terminal domain